MKKYKKYLLLLVTCFAMVMVVFYGFNPGDSMAGDIQYPVVCYEGDELSKVKAWEKQWVGKRIDASNIEGVQEFFPENYYKILKDKEKWGSMWFEIVPYRQMMPTPGDIKYTKQFAGKPKVGSDGNLVDYVSGTPFPNAKTAMELMYNFDNVSFGDNTLIIQDIALIDGIRKYDKRMYAPSHQVFFSNRREIPPVPEVTPNKKEIYRASHSEYFEPAGMRGSRWLSIKWIDRLRDFGGWSYSAGVRRIVRRSTAQRLDAVGGGDATGEDTTIYGWAIPAQDYKLLGRKELLVGRHQNADLLAKGHTEGIILYSGIQRERINTYVIEAIPKDPDHIYSKSIYYMDPETWWLVYSDKYDTQGELWKVFENVQSNIKSIFSDVFVPSVLFALTIDVVRTHGTVFFSPMKIGETGDKYKFGYYTPRALQKYGY